VYKISSVTVVLCGVFASGHEYLPHFLFVQEDKVEKVETRKWGRREKFSSKLTFYRVLGL
jgi:hypothetical protein